MARQWRPPPRGVFPTGWGGRGAPAGRAAPGAAADPAARGGALRPVPRAEAAL